MPLTFSLTHMPSVRSTLVAAVASLILPHAALAESPTIQTEGPIIHLADNLGEETKLGWCIDTEGRGQSDQLHAHSCKPSGGDVLFSYDAETPRIESATYTGQCMAYNAPDSAENPFGLIDCDETDPKQRFVHDSESGQIRLGSDAAQCVTVSATIDGAGPFQSKDLLLGACDDLDPSFTTWVIRD